MSASDIVICIMALLFIGGLCVVLKAPAAPRRPDEHTDPASGPGQPRTKPSPSSKDDPCAAKPSRDSYERVERNQMPAEIAAGRLVTSERTFRRRGARAFYAKVDQGFCTPDGQLVLVETKNRMRVNTSDIVQLSAQAIAIRSEVGDKLGRVADYGYVRKQLMGGKPRYQKFQLYPEEVIDRLVDTYHALRLRRKLPMARPHPSRCGSCVFVAGCANARVRGRPRN